MHQKQHDPNWQKTYCPVPECDKNYLEIKNWRKHCMNKHTNKIDDETKRRQAVKDWEKLLAKTKDTAAEEVEEQEDQEDTADTAAHDESLEILVEPIDKTDHRVNRQIKDLRAENTRLRFILRKLLKIKCAKRLVIRTKLSKRSKRTQKTQRLERLQHSATNIHNVAAYTVVGLDIVPIEPHNQFKGSENIENPVVAEDTEDIIQCFDGFGIEESTSDQKIKATPVTPEKLRIPVMHPSPSMPKRHKLRKRRLPNVSDLRNVLMNKRERKERNDVRFLKNNGNGKVKAPLSPNSLISEALRDSIGPILKREFF